MQSTTHVSLQRLAPSPMPMLTLKRSAVCVHAKKGFGAASKAANDEKKRVSPKSKRINPNPQDSFMQQQAQREEMMASRVQLLQAEEERKEEEEDFNKRLAALKQAALEKSSATASSAPGSAAQVAAFDVKEDIYANPPSIAETLMDQLNADVSDPKLKTANVGPNQLAIAGGAVFFGLLFVLLTGSDYTPSNRYKDVQTAQRPLDSIQEGVLKSRIGTLEEQLKASPFDTAALEELSVSYAKLFEYKKSADALDRLLSKQPDNLEALRLLGETTLLSEQASRSVAAYEKAVALRENDLTIVKGLVNAYNAAGQQSKAVTFLTGLKTKLQAEPAAFVVSEAVQAPAEVAVPGSAEAPDVKADGDSAPVAAAAPAPTRPAVQLDDVSLDLLLAKVYSNWRGHDSDALAVYDTVTREHPADFRGYLAKGKFLKEQGRKADADRMFMQARFYAPASRQSLINKLSQSNPLVELPDNS